MFDKKDSKQDTHTKRIILSIQNVILGGFCKVANAAWKQGVFRPSVQISKDDQSSQLMAEKMSLFK